ncbi:MAG: PAS domain-containing protein [Candidatus Zixiibacteriota bacterium]|nr:MAG: PAS domain-containing protein [candidate division Zixibacteria bacterium]
MKLRRRFITFAVIIHLILVVLSVIVFWQNRYLFLGAELLVVVSLVITIHLYRSFLKPLDLIASGVESIKDQDFSTTFIKTGQEELDSLIDIYNGMIEQLRRERIKQREQHYFLQRLIEATPIGIIILDLDDKVTMLNPAARAILGVESDQAIGCPLDRLKNVPGIELAGMTAGETRIIKVSGVQTYKCRKSHFLDRGFHRHFVLIEELTREIIGTQKRAYAKVIRMMSHEVNNSVGAVNSILHSALDLLGRFPPEESADYKNAIQVAVDRNNGLNEFMANFADVVRLPAPNRERYDLHTVLKSVEVLMGAECTRRNISWKSELVPGPFVVNIDVQQIEQALVNVVKNAIEAVEDGGSVTVKTTDGESRMLRIMDDGRGLAPEAQLRLFTPFYSTKRDGQGIGLTLVREILVNHGFDFNLESNEKGLTEFWIDFGNSRGR